MRTYESGHRESDCNLIACPDCRTYFARERVNEESEAERQYDADRRSA